MVFFDKTIQVACAPSRALALLSKPEEAPRWQAWTTRASVERDGGFRMVQSLLGLRLAWSGVAEAGAASLAFRQTDGDFERLEGAWDVAEAPDGADAARVRLRVRVELPFVLPRMLTDDEIREALSTSLDEALVNLKRLLETGAVPAERPGSARLRPFRASDAALPMWSYVAPRAATAGR